MVSSIPFARAFLAIASPTFWAASAAEVAVQVALQPIVAEVMVVVAVEAEDKSVKSVKSAVFNNLRNFSE